MPGRSAAEAYDAFMVPLRQALATVTAGHLTKEAPRGLQPGEPCAWRLNGGEGAELASGFTLAAAMFWTVAYDPRATAGERYRVTTTGYDYRLDHEAAGEVWSIHWHPDAHGDVQYPHVHFGPKFLGSDDVRLEARHHLPTPRMTFETCIRWCIAYGVSPRQADWEDQLDAAERAHLMYRSWHSSPREVGGERQ